MEQNNNGDKVKIHERVAVLETCYKELKEDIQEIATNHLPHIDSKIRGVEKKIDKMVWLLVITLVGIITELGLRLVQ